MPSWRVGGTTLSTFMRWASLDAAYRTNADTRRNPPPFPSGENTPGGGGEQARAISQARVELGRVGRNLNQLVRRLNLLALHPDSDDVVTPAEVEKTVRELAKRVEALEVALGAVLPVTGTP